MFDDAGHIPVFAGLAALIFAFAMPSMSRSRRAAITAVICLAFGLAVEIFQLVTGRGQFQAQDLWYDVIGIAVGLAVAIVVLEFANRWVLAAVVVIGVVAAVPLLPSDGRPGFEYASDEIERRCKSGAPTAEERTSGSEPEPLVRYRFDAADGTLVRDAAGDLDLEIGEPGAVVRVPGGLVVDGEPPRIGSIEATAGLTAAVEQNDEVSVAVSFTPAVLPQTGPVRVVTISEGTDFGEANVHVGIEGRSVSFRVRSDCDDFNSTLTDALLAVDERVHVVATYRPGLVTIYVDGNEVTSRVTEIGSLDVWDPTRRLFLADEATSDRTFTGAIHDVAIYDVALSATDVRRLVE